MASWRMSFRAGNQGQEMWPHCLKWGVAAITYSALERTDLSKFARGEPKERWAMLQPTQNASLRRVVYEMKKGDTIYVKRGPTIISSGRITGSYLFDSKERIIDENGSPWTHQVPVDWASDFPETPVLLGAEQWTVLELSPDRLKLLESAISGACDAIERTEALEGETFKKEAIFRSRNRALIRAKKANCDFRCEVCNFSFEEAYGEIGRDYIIAHHHNLIAAGPKMTTLDDIALVCANCHAMIHRTKSPIPIEDLRRSFKEFKQK